MGNAAHTNQARKARVRGLLGVSDARINCTSYGVCILRVAPKFYIDGLLALVRTEDEMTVGIEKGLIQMEVDRTE